MTGRRLARIAGPLCLLAAAGCPEGRAPQFGVDGAIEIDAGAVPLMDGAVAAVDGGPVTMCLSVTVDAVCGAGGMASLACDANPSGYAVTCHCSGGRVATSACGQTMPCEERCGQTSCVPGTTIDGLCHGDGRACTNYDCECCSGVCSFHRCRGTCQDVGATCGRGKDCCSGSCVAGRCHCASLGDPDGASCASSGPPNPRKGGADCCSGICTVNGCGCGLDNSSCAFDRDCCAGFFCASGINWRCAACRANGAATNSWSECCSKLAVNNVCVATCTPSCAGKRCGEPSGCGTPCTACDAGETCQRSSDAFPPVYRCTNPCATPADCCGSEPTAGDVAAGRWCCLPGTLTPSGVASCGSRNDFVCPTAPSNVCPP